MKNGLLKCISWICLSGRLTGRLRNVAPQKQGMKRLNQLGRADRHRRLNKHLKARRNKKHKQTELGHREKQKKKKDGGEDVCLLIGCLTSQQHASVSHGQICSDNFTCCNTKRRIQTFEMRCYRKIFGISFSDRITNEDIRNRVRAAIGPHDEILTIVKTRKLRWYGHVTRATGLANTIMQGTVPGGRRRGRPKKCWHDNIKEWTEPPLAKTLRLAEDRDGWRKIIKTLQPPPPSPAPPFPPPPNG